MRFVCRVSCEKVVWTQSLMRSSRRTSGPDVVQLCGDENIDIIWNRHRRKRIREESAIATHEIVVRSMRIKTT